MNLRIVPGGLCTGMVPGNRQEALCSHPFHLSAGSYSLSEYHCLYGLDFLTRSHLYAAFHPIGTGRLCHGHRGGMADVQPRIGLVRILPDNAAGYRLFLKPCILRHGAWEQPSGKGVWRRLVVGVHGCDYGRLQYNSGHRHRASTVRAAGGAGHDDVPHFHSIRNEPSRAAQQGKARLLQKDRTGTGKERSLIVKAGIFLYPPGTTVPKGCYKR